MKNILVLAILCQIFLLGIASGYSYLLYQRQIRSNDCIQEVLDKNIKLKDYFGHPIEVNSIWIHAQAAVSNHYLYCMTRRTKNE